MYKALLAACAAALLVVPTANASKHMLVGINDEADTLYGNPDVTFPILRRLHVQVLRVNLYWGGTKWAVAKRWRSWKWIGGRLRPWCRFAQPGVP